MPVELVAAAVLATGYKGPISLEVFNHSLYETGDDIPLSHSIRGISGLQKLIEAARQLPPFWNTPNRIPRRVVASITSGFRGKASSL